MADQIITNYYGQPYRLTDGSILMMTNDPPETKQLTFNGGVKVSKGWSSGNTITMTRNAGTLYYTGRVIQADYSYADANIRLRPFGTTWKWVGTVVFNWHAYYSYTLQIELVVTPPNVSTNSVFSIVSQTTPSAEHFDTTTTVTGS